MPQGRTKSPAKLKALKEREKTQRNFTVEEIKFIIVNAPEMTVAQLADALDCADCEVEALINQYNSANNDMIKGSYAIPGRLPGNEHLKGVVVATGASSALADESRKGGLGMIKPKTEPGYIFKQPKK